MIYRTFWPRAAAALIDSILSWPLLFLQTGEPLAALRLQMIIILALQNIYFIISHAVYGQTFGKRIFDLKAVRTHQHLPVTWKHAFLRQLLWIVVSIMYVQYFQHRAEWLLISGSVIFIADAITAMIHPRHRSAHDFIGKTVVVKMKG